MENCVHKIGNVTILLLALFYLLLSGCLTPMKKHDSMPYKNTQLSVSDDNWGSTNWNELNISLEAALCYYKSLMTFNSDTPIFILRSEDQLPSFSHPLTEILKDRTNIYLAAENNQQSRFLYQWTHEIIHYALNREFRPDRDKFAWFIESICEMSSIYYMVNYDLTGECGRDVDSRYWRLAHIKYGINQIKKVDYNENDQFLSIYINEKLTELEENRELRDINRVIAVNMLPHFMENPNLWSFIPLLSNIPYTESMSFRDYIEAWMNLIPDNKKEEFQTFVNSLLPS